VKEHAIRDQAMRLAFV
jgi:hypothetical protein